MRYQRTIRFPEKLTQEIDRVVRDRYFSSPTSFIRYAIEQELSGRQDGLIGAEERLAASIEQVRKDMYRLMRVQQALFAYLDTLAKTILTCVPEPPRAKERYERLLKTAGRAMVGDAKLAMQDLITNGEG